MRYAWIEEHRRRVRHCPYVWAPGGLALGIIEVIAAEVGERRGGEWNALGTMLVDTVARRLISDMARPHALETRHVAEKRDDVGRRQPGLHLIVRGRHTERPDRRRAVARHAPDLARHLDR